MKGKAASLSDANGVTLRRRTKEMLKSQHREDAFAGFDPLERASDQGRRGAEVGRRPKGAKGLTMHRFSKTFAPVARRMWTVLPMARLAILAGLLLMSTTPAFGILLTGTSAELGDPLSAEVTVSFVSDVLTFEITNTSPLASDGTPPLIDTLFFNLPSGNVTGINSVLIGTDDVTKTGDLLDLIAGVEVSNDVTGAWVFSTTGTVLSGFAFDFKVKDDITGSPIRFGNPDDLLTALNVPNRTFFETWTVALVTSGVVFSPPTEFYDDIPPDPNLGLSFQNVGSGAACAGDPGCDSGSAFPIPEPATAMLLGSGLLGLLGLRRRRFLKKS